MRKPKESDFVVWITMFADPAKSVTVSDVMSKYSWTHGKAQRCLDRLVKHGFLRRKSRAFWNGMYYAKRFYYW